MLMICSGSSSNTGGGDAAKNLRCSWIISSFPNNIEFLFPFFIENPAKFLLYSNISLLIRVSMIFWNYFPKLSYNYFHLTWQQLRLLRLFTVFSCKSLQCGQCIPFLIFGFQNLRGFFHLLLLLQLKISIAYHFQVATIKISVTDNKNEDSFDSERAIVTIFRTSLWRTLLY